MQDYPLLDVQNATVFCEGTRVFDRLSLTVPVNKSSVILGPNGGGKSTLLKLIFRKLYHVHAEDARVRILGKERWNLDELKPVIGLVSDDLQNKYHAHATGEEVVLSGYYASIGIWPHQAFSQEQRAHAAGLMERMQVDHLGQRRYDALSTGERRRFLLARALVHDPRILILDEPTSGLDLKGAFQYIDIVRKFIQQGKTVVLVTHHIHEIPPEIDHAILLKQGEVLEEGDPKELLRDDLLSMLFDTAVQVVEAGGFYQVLPRSE